MKKFEFRNLREAIRYAEAGGQALHVHRVISNPRRAPRCFMDAIRRGELIAHLFDQDRVRLHVTARSLGVNIVKIEREGTSRMHVDLCGKPLQRALNRCKMRELDASPAEN